MPRRVVLEGLADGAELRTANYEGVEHLVVPVVALVGDSVVSPMNGTGPELVPAEELAANPQGWNGRPVLADHPIDNNEPTSANIPQVLESKSFGQLFNTRFDDNKLKTEAWLNTDKIDRVGDEAIEVVNRIKDGEMVEVSVGAFITAQRRSGIIDGKRYDTVWSDIVPDHLALGLNGAIGACSVEMGCGAPRAAKLDRWHNSTSFLDTLFKSMQVEGVADSDLHHKLWMALESTEPAFEGIIDVYQKSKTVVYATFADDIPRTFTRSYSIRNDEVVLVDDRQEVEVVSRFEPLNGDSPVLTSLPAGAIVTLVNNDNNTIDKFRYCSTTNTLVGLEGCENCNCKGGSMSGASGTSGASDSVKALVNRLIEVGAFTNEDEERLSAIDEETLGKMVEGFNEVVEEVVAEPMTEEDWMANAPQSLRSMVAKYKAEDEQRRADRIEALTSAQSEWSADDLSAKSTDELESLCRMLKVDEPKDYSIKGAKSNDDTPAPPPRLFQRTA